MPEFVATNAALSAVQTELAAARDAAQVFKPEPQYAFACCQECWLSCLNVLVPTPKREISTLNMTSQAEKKALEAEVRRLTMIISEMQNGGESGDKDNMATENEYEHRFTTSEDILKGLQEKDVS